MNNDETLVFVVDYYNYFRDSYVDFLIFLFKNIVYIAKNI